MNNTKRNSSSDGGEQWHDRYISEVVTRLGYLSNNIQIVVSKRNQQGADIRICVRSSQKQINIEIQQFDSGAPFKSNTIPTWKKRHKWVSIIVFPEPTLERLRKKIPTTNDYSFFSLPDVYLFSDKQLSELVAFVGCLVLQEENRVP